LVIVAFPSLIWLKNFTATNKFAIKKGVLKSSFNES
jgi:hypothetical protein